MNDASGRRAYALFGDFLSRLRKFSLGECDVETVRSALVTINNFFYQQPAETETFVRDGEVHEYFSKYHIFWHECHEEVLKPTISNPSCRKVANILHSLSSQPGARELFRAASSPGELPPRALAQIRFFTAPQDFRGSIDLNHVFEVYSDDPERFEPQAILDDTDGFLKAIMRPDRANEQRDAREKFARTCAELLLELKTDAYDLAARFDCRADLLRRFLIEENEGTGFGAKKCDMFLRDMLVWKVWRLKHVECINVASDSNTIRVALRTRILTTAVPLLSSFLDVFCYQYELIDDWNARAWRRVWELWHDAHPETCPECPALLDHFIYRVVGREFCQDRKLSVLKCSRDPGHIIFWHSAQKKLCPKCSPTNRGKLVLVSQHLPCTHEQGKVAIQQSKYVTGPHALLPGITECPFAPVCKPRTDEFRPRIAPDSISIYRATGWLTAYTTEERAGGGLSS